MDLRPVPYGRPTRSLVDFLEDELASGQPPCGVTHHTDDEAACMRKGTHHVDGEHSRDLHAAKRVWSDSDPEPVWATWMEQPPTPSHP